MKIYKLLEAGAKYIINRNYRFLINAGFGFYNLLVDEKYLMYKYSAMMDKDLNLKNPQSFNEKLQWLKLYDRRPEYTAMVDKYTVREYIAKTIGEEYLIPLIGVWSDPDEIDFNRLPKKFVLKCNHNSGLGMCICEDKTKLNINYTKKLLKKGVKQNYYLAGREWPYKNVPRKIIAEKYMVDDSGELRDYKLMCFNGIVKCIFTCTERFSKTGLKVTVFNPKWERMPFQRYRHPSSALNIKPPNRLNEMIQLAEMLSRGIAFVRVDFYEVKNRIYFGELTFYPGSGFEKFALDEWDYTLGSWLQLPERDIEA